MGLKQNVLQRQLEHAKARLDACEKALSERDDAPKKFNSDPEWRRRSAAYRQIKRRIQGCEALRPATTEAGDGEADA